MPPNLRRRAPFRLPVPSFGTVVSKTDISSRTSAHLAASFFISGFLLADAADDCRHSSHAHPRRNPRRYIHTSGSLIPHVFLSQDQPSPTGPLSVSMVCSTQWALAMAATIFTALFTPTRLRTLFAAIHMATITVTADEEFLVTSWAGTPSENLSASPLLQPDLQKTGHPPSQSRCLNSGMSSRIQSTEGSELPLRSLTFSSSVRLSFSKMSGQFPDLSRLEPQFYAV